MDLCVRKTELKIGKDTNDALKIINFQSEHRQMLNAIWAFEIRPKHQIIFFYSINLRVCCVIITFIKNKQFELNGMGRKMPTHSFFFLKFNLVRVLFVLNTICCSNAWTNECRNFTRPTRNQNLLLNFVCEIPFSINILGNSKAFRMATLNIALRLWFFHVLQLLNLFKSAHTNTGFVIFEIHIADLQMPFKYTK